MPVNIPMEIQRQAPLDRAWIAARIPHAGSMCLLDRIVAWGPDHIRCEADGHTSPDHPLRAEGRLAAVCGIEYAAQAMAAHAAVLEASATRPRMGYLASVRKVEIRVARLDTFPGPLIIEATRIGGDAGNVLYGFAVQAGARVLLAGRAAVILDVPIEPAPEAA
jgi:predicted hotdog family 3-hydroxylacyl-ACP dehydratase